VGLSQKREEDKRPERDREQSETYLFPDPCPQRRRDGKVKRRMG